MARRMRGAHDAKDAYIHAPGDHPPPPVKKRARVKAGAPSPAEGRNPDATQLPPAAMTAHGMRLEPHVCRVCFSRLVSEPVPGAAGGLRRYSCTNCDAVAPGLDASVLCCCGIKLRKSGKSGRTGLTEVDAGIRCVRNPSPTAEFPSLFVAAEVG